MSGKTQSEKIDTLFKQLGVWGRYQILQMMLVKSLTIPACFQLYMYMYLGYQPPLRCQSVVNVSSAALMYLPPNTTVDNSYHKTCKELVEYNNNSITAIKGHCDSGYDYDLHKYSTLVTQRMKVWLPMGQHTNLTAVSIQDFKLNHGRVMECNAITYLNLENLNSMCSGEIGWDLVCDKSYQAQLTQTVFVIGQGIGATIFTSLADRFGRKKVCLASQWIMLIVSLGTVFSPSILVFTLIRVVMGAVQQGHVMSVHVMPLEVLPKTWRAMIHLLGGFMWTGCLCILCGLAYGLKDTSWRYMQLASVTGTVVTLIPNMIFLDESLRWLLANGRTVEARKIIDKAAKMNGIHPDDVKQVKQECLEESKPLTAPDTNLIGHRDGASKKEQKFTVVDIFRHSRLRQAAFVMFFAWIANAGTSFGLSLTAAKLSGRRFLNYFLISVANLPAGIVSYITMQRIGRKFTCIVSHFIAGTALLSAALVNAYTGPSGWVTGLTVIGKFGISMSWGTLFQYTPELYPTNLRSVGLGIASSSARIGGMLAPFATIVMDYLPWLPGSIYGGCCLIVGCLLFLLPETVDKELPQTIEEIKTWKKIEKK